MFPDLPFGNADGDKVEARKGQLDSFLKVGNAFFPRVIYFVLLFDWGKFALATEQHPGDLQQRGHAGVPGTQL